VQNVTGYSKKALSLLLAEATAETDDEVRSPEEVSIMKEVDADARSEAARSEVSDASDAMAFANVMELLHRDSSRSGEKHKHPALGKLRHMCYLMFFLAIALSYYSTSYPEDTALYMEDNLKQIYMASNRQSLIAGIVVISESIFTDTASVLG
jgi:hypothetical protein